MDDGPATSVEPRLLRTYLDLSPDAAFVVDASGRIVAANELSEAMFGYSVEELVGVSIETLVPEPLRDHHARLREGTPRTHTGDRWGRASSCGAGARTAHRSPWTSAWRL